MMYHIECIFSQVTVFKTKGLQVIEESRKVIFFNFSCERRSITQLIESLSTSISIKIHKKNFETIIKNHR